MPVVLGLEDLAAAGAAGDGWPLGEAVLRFENTTPLWAGGPRGESILEAGPDGRIAPVAHLAPAIVGRARWVLRALCRERENGDEPSHKTCERNASKVFGSLEKAAPVAVHARLENLPGEKDLYLPPSILEGLDNIFAVLSWRVPRSDVAGKGRGYVRWSDVANALSIAGFRLLRERAGLHHRPRIGRLSEALLDREPSSTKSYRAQELIRAVKKLVSNSDAERFLVLLTVPRYLLHTFGAEERGDARYLYEAQPLPTGHRLVVRLTARTHGAPLGEAALAVALALTVFGVGRAATRGFGRYKLVEFEGLKGSYEHLLEELRSAQEKGARRLAGIIKSIFEEMGGARDASAPLLPYLPGATVMYRECTVHPAPFHIQEIINISGHPPTLDCSNIHDREERVLCQLSAIGMATLKSTWKVYAGRRVKSPGPDLHTWPLGLPRGQTGGHYSNSTGYLLGPGPGQGKASKDLECYCPNNKPDPGRLQSPITLFPACRGLVMVAAPLTGDLADLIEPQALPKRRPRRGEVLLHAGRHRDNPPRVHSILHIACNSNVKACCPECVELSSVECTINIADAGGILLSDGQPANLGSCDPFDVARAAEDVARGWLGRLLSLRVV